MVIVSASNCWREVPTLSHLHASVCKMIAREPEHTVAVIHPIVPVVTCS